MTRFYRIGCIVLCSLLIGSAVHGQKWGKVTPEEWAITPPAEYPDAGAVVIFDVGEATTEYRGLETTRHTRLKVFDPDNMAGSDSVVIEYFNYDHLHHEKAQIFRDGEKIEIDKKSFEKVEQGSKRLCIIRVSDLRPGDIFEYSYGIDYYGGLDKLGPEKYFMFSQDRRYGGWKVRELIGDDGWDKLMGKKFSNIPSWYFDHPVPVMRSQFVAKLGAEMDYTFCTTNIPGDKIDPVMERVRVLSATAYKKHTWEMYNLAPFALNEGVVYGEQAQRVGIHFQVFSTDGQNRALNVIFTDKHYQYIGESFQGYLIEYVKKTRSMKKDLKGLVGEAATDSDKLAAIYHFLTTEFSPDSTGYVLRPRHTNMKSLYKKKAGMPFEINLLLVELAKMAGLEASPVLISTVDKIGFRHTCRFDHMLAMITLDGQTLFVDASVSGCEPGSVPPLCQAREGVLVDYSDSRIVEIATEACLSSL